MKQLTFVLVIVLVLVPFAPASVTATASTDAASVTGTAQGLFGSGTALGTVTLDRMQMGTGVFIEPNGSAAGVFHVVLLGRSLLGRAQNITVEGNVTQGNLSPDGRATFSGIATVDLGDGTPILPSVVFNVTMTADSVGLALDSTTLPAAALTTGAVIIE